MDIKKYRLCFITQTVFLYFRYYPILDMQHDTKKKHSKHYGRYTLRHFGYASLAAPRDLCLGTYHTDSTLYRRKETLCE